MKKKYLIILACFVTIILLSCATSPYGKASSEQRELDKVMNNWIRAFTTEDIDLLMSTIGSNAILETVFNGERKQYIGETIIRRVQGGGFEHSDIYLETSVSVLERDFGNKIAEYTCEAEGPGFLMINRFRFQKQDGEWKIIHQIVEPPPAE